MIKKLLFLQKGEITDYVIYSKLALKQKLLHNKDILTKIAQDELKHYHFLEGHTNKSVKPNVIARVLGLTFGIKLMEKGEDDTQQVYNEISEKIEGIQNLIDDTGIASLSMASSEYLSTKQEESHRFAFKSALYTVISYVFAVAFLIAPYMLFSNKFMALGITISIVVMIIFIFNYYISIAKDLSFKKRFIEMVSLSLGVATLSFFIGYIVNRFLGI